MWCVDKCDIDSFDGILCTSKFVGTVDISFENSSVCCVDNDTCLSKSVYVGCATSCYNGYCATGVMGNK